MAFDLMNVVGSFLPKGAIQQALPMIARLFLTSEADQEDSLWEDAIVLGRTLQREGGAAWPAVMELRLMPPSMRLPKATLVLALNGKANVTPEHLTRLAEECLTWAQAVSGPSPEDGQNVEDPSSWTGPSIYDQAKASEQSFDLIKLLFPGGTPE